MLLSSSVASEWTNAPHYRGDLSGNCHCAGNCPALLWLKSNMQLILWPVSTLRWCSSWQDKHIGVEGGGGADIGGIGHMTVSHDSSRFERTPLLPVLKREVHAFSSPRLDYSWCTWSLPQCCNTLFKLLQNSLFSIANFQIWTHRTLPFSPSVDVCFWCILTHLVEIWTLHEHVRPLKSPSQLFVLTELTSQHFYQLRQLQDVFISLFIHSSTATLFLLPW